MLKNKTQWYKRSLLIIIIVILIIIDIGIAIGRIKYY